MTSDISSGNYCPSCQDIYMDPKVLPCGKSMCNECIPDQDEFECNLCSERHVKTPEGFLQNESLASLVDQNIVKSDQDLDKRNYRLKVIKHLIEEAESQSKFPECEALLDEHFMSIKSSIDLKTESLIEVARKKNQELIDRAKEYQEQIRNELKAQMEAKAQQITSCKKEVGELIKSDKPRDQVAEELKQYIQHLRKEMSELEKLHKEHDVVKFTESQDEIELGSVARQRKSEDEFETFDLAQFFKAKHLNISDIDSIQLAEHQNMLILAYKRVNRSAVYLVKLDSEFRCKQEVETKFISDYLDFKLCTSNSQIFLIFNSRDKSVIFTFDNFNSSYSEKIQVPISIARSFNQCIIHIIRVEYYNYQYFAWCLSDSYSSAYIVRLNKNNISSSYRLTESFFGMRTKNDKMFAFNSRELIVYSMNDFIPVERIQNFPYAPALTSRFDFLIDSHENFIFVERQDKVSQLIYVSFDGKFICKKELYDPNINHFFIDKRDNVYLVNTKQLVVYRIRK